MFIDHVEGYEGASIEEITDENGLFLPGYNMPEKAAALPTAREDARRVSCYGNLRHLAMSALVYSGDRDGHFPPDFSALIMQGYQTALVIYTCPSTDTTAAQNFEEFQTGRHCDYVYFGKELTEDCRGYEPAKTILGCDKPGNHQEYFNVWFGDTLVKGYSGRSIEEIADENGLFLPGYNMPEKAKTEETRTPE